LEVINNNEYQTMDIKQFIENRPYLYHLTSESNSKLIIAQRKIYSANELIRKSKDEKNLQIQRQKRYQHLELIIDGTSYFLRDQKPISEKALGKCLTNGWNVGDFLCHLNDRVFMWPTLERLWRHFNRYESEKPIIFRFPTKNVLELNTHAQFCRINSGATRANSYLDGKAPERGPNTFLIANKFNWSIRDVAEVTFPNYCDINIEFEYGYSPEGIFERA
jgi:hypothetical protein